MSHTVHKVVVSLERRADTLLSYIRVLDYLISSLNRSVGVYMWLKHLARLQTYSYIKLSWTLLFRMKAYFAFDTKSFMNDGWGVVILVTCSS